MKQSDIQPFKRLFEKQKEEILKHHGMANQLNRKDFVLQKDEVFDEVDLSSVELEQQMMIRLRSRERQLLKKIDAALQRIEDGSFGECIECGDSIGKGRLNARPVATHCVLCKEEQEKRESLFAARSA